MLKYLVLASMLGQSRIDPFDSQVGRLWVRGGDEWALSSVWGVWVCVCPLRQPGG